MLQINFEPSPKQALAWYYLHDKTTTELGYGGAASGGKSWLIVMFIIITCLQYPGIAFGLGRKELVTLKRTTLRTLFKAFSLYGLKKKVIISTTVNKVLLLLTMVVLFFYLILLINLVIHFILALVV